ncbi:MAG: hypothetical protein EHM70_06580 [Chloroflexota bacterium]|nr:MAG: hypothetical protein EHM70_06580 [Chloroflexota bacterium]
MEGPLDWYESAAAGGRPRRYFCPIWQDETSAGQRWWMTFNQNTYAHDLLRLLGGDNVFAARVRRYPLAADLGQALPQDPGEHDTRYPRVTLEEILAADPEVILLPSEPYVFAEHHQEEMLTLLESTQAARNHKVYLVDGSLITWHGTRLARALRELPALLEGN